MNTNSDHDSVHDSDREFDARMQQQHAQSLAQVSARTQAQLHARRHATAASTQRSPMRAFAWPLAAACAAGVLAIGLQWRQPDTTLAVTPPIAAVSDDELTSTELVGTELASTYAALDETPDLYLWLASSDAAAFAME